MALGNSEPEQERVAQLVGVHASDGAIAALRQEVQRQPDEQEEDRDEQIDEHDQDQRDSEEQRRAQPDLIRNCITNKVFKTQFDRRFDLQSYAPWRFFAGCPLPDIGVDDDCAACVPNGR